MRDTAWLDDDESAEPTSPRRARPLMIVLAALPWLVVIALFAIPDSTAAPRTDGADSSDAATSDGTRVGVTDTPVTDTPVTDTPDGAKPPDTSRPHEPELPTASVQPRTGPPAAVLDESDPDPGLHAEATSPTPAHDPDLAALAVLAARHWLSGADQRDDVLGLPVRDTTEYAEHLHLEGFEGDGDLLVARVVALILDVDAARAPRLQRIAVPLAATEDGPRLLGEPWELPTPTPATVALSTQTLTDPTLADAAEQALRDAGFDSPRIRRLARTAGWPLVVTFTTGQRDAERQVWLRAGTGGALALAGLPTRPDPVRRRSGGAHDPTTDAGEPS